MQKAICNLQHNEITKVFTSSVKDGHRQPLDERLYLLCNQNWNTTFSVSASYIRLRDKLYVTTFLIKRPLKRDHHIIVSVEYLP